MDAQSTVGEVAALVALVQSLARLELEEESPRVTPSAEVPAVNRFLAPRDGMNARLIDSTAGCLIPAGEMLEALLERCRPHAHALGCAAALERVPRLVTVTGAERQRAFPAPDGRLDRLVACLAEGTYDDGIPTPASTKDMSTTQPPTGRSGKCAAGSHTPDLQSS